MDSEVREIVNHIERNESFVLHGGAGSGKTHSLIELLRYLYKENAKLRIVCITYTNVAVNEIRKRAPFDYLEVYTIHDFLWNIIKEYQLNVKESIISLVEDEMIGVSSSSPDIEVLKDIYSNKVLKIEYKEWKDIGKGIISHDDVPIISEFMFKRYQLLCKIIADKLDYVFIDEYQDTDQAVINILLEHINKDNQLIVGFFGDRMQSIYGSDSIDITSHIASGVIKEVIKSDNRRNPNTIIGAMNRVRHPFDALEQNPANDPGAPNYNKEGLIKFLYSDSQKSVDEIKASEYFINWNFSDSDDAKELYLTYRLIGPIAGFPLLLEIHSNDQILKFKDRVKKHIKTNGLDEPDEDKTFEQVIKQYSIRPTPGMQNFIDQHLALFEEAKKTKYSKIKNIYVDRQQLTGNVKASKGEDGRNRQDPRTVLSKHLCAIQYYVELYKSKQYGDLINHIDFNVTSIGDKKKISEIFETLLSMKDQAIIDVIEYAHDHNICLKDDNFISYIDTNQYVYNRVKNVPYYEVTNLFHYREGYTIYSTQHNVKGAEYNKVFVILDNGRWNQYNFKNLFENTGSASVKERTRKIFYVCCTRAKEELIIYYPEPSENVLDQARRWFGEANIIRM